MKNKVLIPNRIESISIERLGLLLGAVARDANDLDLHTSARGLQELNGTIAMSMIALLLLLLLMILSEQAGEPGGGLTTTTGSD